MTDPTLDRRALLAGLTGTILAPAATLAAPSDAFDALAERADGLDQLRALVVLHRGKTRFARAFRGPDLDTPVNVKSVSKTIVALLTGIAIERAVLPGTEARLGDLIGDLIPRAADRRAADITIADLLTMRAGLERTSGPNYGAWVNSPDWLAYALSRPFVAEPGERFQYSTGSYHVLGAVLSRAADDTLPALARAWLGAPLGIAVPAWTRDPQGFYMGGNNMLLSPRAMARIGEMVRRGGAFEGAQVVPEAWIATSFEPRTRSPFSGDHYGFGWFLTEIAGIPTAYARGYGGQMIYVMRDADLVVAVTSDPTRPARSGGHVGDLHALVAEAIVPALAG